MAKKQNTKLTVLQICNRLKFNKNNRGYVDFKYKGETHTLNEWKSLFKKDKLDFN